MEHAISLPLFDRLWKESNTEQKSYVEKLLGWTDFRGLKQWMRTHPSIDLGEKSMKTLREIAQRQSIFNYSRLTKLELISEIAEREKNDQKRTG